MDDQGKPDPKEWPFEAHVEYPDGREYSQFARHNDDGTVSFISWGENGPTIRVVPRYQATLKERPWEKATAWRSLYAEAYGAKEVQKIFSQESLDNELRVGRELVAKGERPESDLDTLKELEESFRGTTLEDWDAYNFFFTHFPSETSDHALLVVRGLFLIDRKILQNFGAFPRSAGAFWRKIGKLNFLRDQVTREIASHELAELIDDFVAEFGFQSSPEERGDKLAMAIRLLYGEVHRMVRPVREKSDV
jgi:hypothetical protein